MVYDAELEERVKAEIADWGTVAKKMFGGTAHLLNGNLLCGVHENNLILRLGRKTGDAALKKPFVKPFDITGRPLKGWVMVDRKGLTGTKLSFWLKKAREFVETLPAK